MSDELLPCYCHGEDIVTYCPRHTPLPGEADHPEPVTAEVMVYSGSFLR